MKYGMEGIGIYWCIVEMLYENSGYILPEYDRITFELRSEETVIQSIINDFGLFEFMDGKITSQAVLRQINYRFDKSIKARESITKRWDKYERNTNVLPTNEDRNTKESKVKERKEKKKEGDFSIVKKVKRSKEEEAEFQHFLKMGIHAPKSVNYSIHKNLPL